MALLIKNGTLITASDTFKADILVEGEKIRLIGENLVHPSALVIDATGKFITPSGVDPHCHFDLPIMCQHLRFTHQMLHAHTKPIRGISESVYAAALLLRTSSGIARNRKWLPT